ncbi:MAG: hypothetical protein HYY86_03410 [Candidatus Harrisonbacteria bacterium]|nr:hypothetical protein [Candidatus Harrisonbacteria bacterium]
MKEEVVVDDSAFDEKERLCLLSVAYVMDGRQLFQASFIPCHYGTAKVEMVEKNPPVHIPNDIFLLMRNKAIEEFKKEGLYLSKNEQVKQLEFPLE